MRNNSSADGLTRPEGLSPVYCLSPVSLSPVVGPSVAAPSVSLLSPSVLVQADGIEARHVDSLADLQELLRDLVGRDREEDRPYRDPAIIRLRGCLHRPLHLHRSGGE